MHLSDFVELQSSEEIVSVIDIKDFDTLNYVALFSKQGQGKRVILSDFKVSRNNKTFTALKLKDGDELVGAKLSNGTKDVLLITKRGMASLYSENDVQIYGTKSNGTRSCYMPPIDEICAFAMVENGESVTLIANNSLIKRINVDNIAKVSKKNLGKSIFPTLKTKEIVVNDVEVTMPTTEIFVQIDGETPILNLDKVGNYNLTSTAEGFSKIKSNNILSISFKHNQVSNENFSPKITYDKPSEKEETIMNESIEKINILDMDIDAILKKFDKK
ncbi:UNVERIFIED_CONTAM: hypothetical protein O8I53_06030 [Campylobacter lari]